MIEASITILLGPTGVGKTDLSLSMAQEMGSPIISCDSRQIYKELNIGVARPSAKVLEAVEHFFIADKSIQEPYAAGKYEEDAWILAEKLLPSHPQLLMVGGSCLYIDAFCNGMDYFPDPDMDLRAELNAILAREGGLEELRSRLFRLDPVSYNRIDLSNGTRILRAVEVCLQTGRPFSSFHTHESKPRPCLIRKIGLRRSREDLYARINRRVEQMMDEGLLEEASALYKYRALPSLNTVGYKELFSYLDGSISLSEAVRQIQRNTRHYAKKQMSWWARDKDILWQDLEG